MKRDIESELKTWKSSRFRKPLLLQGARQTGKTWVVKKFGKDSFEQIAYFNFDEQSGLKQFFSETKDTSRILDHLALVFGKAIVPDETLIFFDEIQECNDALNALKYFHENNPEYAIVGAGSLLGVALSKGASFPVGKVDIKTLYPLTFNEFLQASDPELGEYLNQYNTFNPIPDIFFSRLMEKLKVFYITGGMPEPVSIFLEDQYMERLQHALLNIMKAYALDFSKHIAGKDIPKVSAIWNSMPSQLARENKKFVYQKVKQGARAREYEDALQWLVMAGLIYKINRCTKPSLPLSSYDDLSDFKLYMLDTGLLRRASLLDPSAITEGNRLFTEFKGALTENFVLQNLLTQFEVLPRYWSSGNMAEIDFLLQFRNEVIPVEVKSDINIRGKSLAFYYNKFHPVRRIRFSLKNLRLEDNLINIPLFMAGYTETLLERSMEVLSY
nr:ATP-binding protein [Bacteroidota bacterium]